METLNLPEASVKPSFEASLSQGFYIVTFDQGSEITFDGITADMLYGFYVSQWKIIQHSYPVKWWLDANNPQTSIEKLQEDIIGTQAFSKYAQSIPSPIPIEDAVKKFNITTLQNELQRLENLIRNSWEYRSKVKETMDRINAILDTE